MLGMAHSVKNLHVQNDCKPLAKSQSTNKLQVRRLKCLSKSVLQQSLEMKKKQHFSITDFKLGKKLGKGRFGNVFLAEEKETGFVLAMKIINKK